MSTQIKNLRFSLSNYKNMKNYDFENLMLIYNIKTHALKVGVNYGALFDNDLAINYLIIFNEYFKINTLTERNLKKFLLENQEQLERIYNNPNFNDWID